MRNSEFNSTGAKSQQYAVDIRKIQSRLHSAKRRCTNPNSINLKSYSKVLFEFPSVIEGARAIYNRDGPIPEGMTLDRINPWLGYNVQNLRYATYATQAVNKRNPPPDYAED